MWSGWLRGNEILCNRCFWSQLDSLVSAFIWTFRQPFCLKPRSLCDLKQFDEPFRFPEPRLAFSFKCTESLLPVPAFPWQAVSPWALLPTLWPFSAAPLWFPFLSELTYPVTLSIEQLQLPNALCQSAPSAAPFAFWVARSVSTFLSTRHAIDLILLELLSPFRSCGNSSLIGVTLLFLRS